MDKLNRLYKLHHLLRHRRLPIALMHIQTELDCSERTARRVIAVEHSAAISQQHSQQFGDCHVATRLALTG